MQWNLYVRQAVLDLIVILATGAMICCDFALPDMIVRGPSEQVTPDGMRRAVTIEEQPTLTPNASVVESTEAAGCPFEALYDQLNPSVVNVLVINKVRTEPHSDTPGFRFFGPQNQEQLLIQGMGSGFIYDDKGHIITNNHVVSGADHVQVTFWDDVVFAASVVGVDPDTDLAVLRVYAPKERLRPLPIADSDTLRVGQQVVAIGNAFGLQGTMTTGIISALGRFLPTAGGTETGHYVIPDVIQTDAAINPGNSGGPLLDLQGRVVGVNAAIESPVRGFAGVGFAIPANIVKKVVPALIQHGHYEHPWLGVTTLDLAAPLAEAMDLASDQRGLLVVDVEAEGPASLAGLRPSRKSVQIDGERVSVGGDVVLAIDGHPMKTFDDLVAYLLRHGQVGQEVQLSVLRDGELIEVTLTLAPRPRSTP
jgi:serine protease Do